MEQTVKRMKKVITNTTQTPDATFSVYCKSNEMRANEFYELLKSIRGKIARFESDKIFEQLVKKLDPHAVNVPKEQRGLLKEKFLDFFGRHGGDSGPVSVSINIVDVIKPLREILNRQAGNFNVYDKSVSMSQKSSLDKQIDKLFIGVGEGQMSGPEFKKLVKSVLDCELNKSEVEVCESYFKSKF